MDPNVLDLVDPRHLETCSTLIFPNCQIHHPPSMFVRRVPPTTSDPTRRKTVGLGPPDHLNQVVRWDPLRRMVSGLGCSERFPSGTAGVLVASKEMEGNDSFSSVHLANSLVCSWARKPTGNMTYQTYPNSWLLMVAHVHQKFGHALPSLFLLIPARSGSKLRRKMTWCFVFIGPLGRYILHHIATFPPVPGTCSVLKWFHLNSSTK